MNRRDRKRTGGRDLAILAAMRLLIFSDIHSDARALAKLMETEADYYFAAGDLVNWARGFEKAGPVLQRRAIGCTSFPETTNRSPTSRAFANAMGFTTSMGRRCARAGTRSAGAALDRESTRPNSRPPVIS